MDANDSEQAIAGQCEALTYSYYSYSLLLMAIFLSIINEIASKDQKIQVKVEDLFLHGCLFQEIKSLQCDWGQNHHLVAQSGNDIFNRTSDNLGLIFLNSFLLEG